MTRSLNGVDDAVRRLPARCAVGWAAGTAGALALTLQSLAEEPFDGLNNIVQIPFALPWFLLPLPAVFGWSYETDAWVTAVMGWANAVLLYLLLLRRVRRRTLVDATPL